MEKIRKERGITLVALVITIIIMLILVAVTINAAFSENGLIARAREAADRWKEAQENELALLENIIEDNLNGLDPGEEGKDEKKGEQVETPGNHCPPYTRFYDDKGLTTAVIPTGFVASTVEGETEIGNGKVIKSITGLDTSEFVWVPVPHAYIDVTGICDDCINLDLTNEANLGYYPMAIKIDATNYKGVLYLATGITEVTLKPSTYTTEGIDRREPTTVTNDAILENIATVVDDVNEFPGLVQEEYNSMIKSVIANGGFYFGRYETSIRTGTGETATVQSVKNVPPMTSLNWWKMYANQRIYAQKNGMTEIATSMLYGSQWDQVMIWMRDIDNTYLNNGRKYVRDSTGMGNHEGEEGFDEWPAVGPANTGCVAVKNIYDIAGNVSDLTQEASGATNRVIRRRKLLFYW